MADKVEHRQPETRAGGQAGVSQQLELVLIGCSVVFVVKV